MFNGEDVSPLYYVAALFYIITRLKTRDQIDEFFETLKRVFMDTLDESHPPPLLSPCLHLAKGLRKVQMTMSGVRY